MIAAAHALYVTAMAAIVFGLLVAFVHGALQEAQRMREWAAQHDLTAAGLYSTAATFTETARQARKR